MTTYIREICPLQCGGWSGLETPQGDLDVDEGTWRGFYALPPKLEADQQRSLEAHWRSAHGELPMSDYYATYEVVEEVGLAIDPVGVALLGVVVAAAVAILARRLRR